MKAFAGSALLITCILATYVGFRLLSAWWRTRQVPELAIGTGMVATAGGMIWILVDGGSPDIATRPHAQLLWVLPRVVLGLNVPALAIGYWKIFRPKSNLAALSAGALTALSVAWVIARGSQTPGAVEANLPAGLMDVQRLLLYGWGSIEAFRYSGMLRRRVALGLADAMVAHRFWLWSVAAALQVVVTVSSALSRLVFGLGMLESALGMLILGGAGAGSSIAIALAFFPPRWYQSTIALRAERAPSQAA